MRPLLTQSRRVIVSFEMGSRALGNKRHSPTPDVPNAPDPHSNRNTSAADARLRLLVEDVQEDYCGQERKSNARNLAGTCQAWPQEMNPFKAGSPAPSHIGRCRNIFTFAVVE